MRATVIDACIRGCEEKTNKNGDAYLLVRLEDDTGKAAELVDKDLDRKQYYKRDTIGDVLIDIDLGSKWKTTRIVDFTIKAGR